MLTLYFVCGNHLRIRFAINYTAFVRKITIRKLVVVWHQHNMRNQTINLRYRKFKIRFEFKFCWWWLEMGLSAFQQICGKLSKSVCQQIRVEYMVHVDFRLPRFIERLEAYTGFQITFNLSIRRSEVAWISQFDGYNCLCFLVESNAKCQDGKWQNIQPTSFQLI